MQASQERRSNEALRVPLDVLVSLAHRDFDEPFQADAVNLSTGGLSMRAAYLPEIGSRLACRFECPPLGAPLEAEGEVVWAADEGQHMGEFGVRFVSLDERSEQAIRALVGGDSELDEASTPHAHPLARLFLDGVPTPIVARVTHRADDLMTVEQELPFLALDKAVTVRDPSGASRHGRIGSIDLQLCGELPRLVLQVVFDAPDAPPIMVQTRPVTLPGDDRTDPDLVAPTMAPAAYADDEAEHAAIRRSSAGAIAAVHAEQTSAQVARAAQEATQVLRAARETAQVVREERAGAPVAVVGVPQTKFALVLATVLPLLARARAEAIALWEHAKPVLLSALLQGRVTAVALAHRVGPATRRASQRSIALAGHFASVVREKISARAAEKRAQAQKPRRTTTPAPAVTAPSEWRSRKATEATPAPIAVKRPIGRYVVLGAASLGALALGAYTFSGGDEAPVVVPATASSAAPAAPKPVATPAATALKTPSAPSAALPAAAAVAVTPSTPTALTAPTYIAGHLPPPTYPTLQAAVRPSVAPAALPGASPYAIDVRAESIAGRDPTLRAPAGITTGAPSAAPSAAAVPTGTTSFGQPTVARGQTFTLRMSQNVAGIVGHQDPAGFDVRILGALTLDRAAPIAAAHPAVATAMIINRGDHADLAIRFREGMAPAYRVVARGAALEITIARR